MGLCEGLVQSGCELRVLTTNADGPARVLEVSAERYEQIRPGLAVRYCRRWMADAVSPGLLAALPEAMRWADVVHLQAVYSFPTFPVLAACRAADKPLVWSPHGALQRWSGSTKVAAKRVWELSCQWLRPQKMALHTTCAEEAAASSDRLAGVEVFVLPNGVELPDDPGPAPASDGVLRLLYLGRLHPKKGIDRLLEACALLALRSDLSWSLCIAGASHDDYDQQLRAQITERGLADKVRMLGHVEGDAKTRVLREADVLLAPSHTENFCLVVAEALAHARPVIASRGMPWQVLETERCGMWIDARPAPLAAAIERMASAPREAMGQRGRAYVARELSWPAIALQMRDRYAALVA
jgi:glycosyltransferase involved in cell wall biosynthesis